MYYYKVVFPLDAKLRIKMKIYFLCVLFATIFGFHKLESTMSGKADKFETVIKAKVPFVVSDNKGFDRCVQGYDAVYPCFGREIEVQNPLSNAVIVTVGCGKDLEATAIVRPRQVYHFDLGTDRGSLEKGQCRIVSWIHSNKKQ